MTRRARVIVTAAALALLATACTTTVAGRPAPDLVALQSAPPASEAPTSAPSGAVPTGVPLVLDPLIPGWNPVRSVNRGAVYDAPPAWEVLGEGVQIGFGEPGEGGVGSTGAATLGERDCAGGGISWRAIAVVRHETTISLAEAAKVNAELWAGKAYLDDDKRAPTLSTGSPESITTLSGLPATVVRVAVTSASSGPCLAAKGAVYAVAANGFTGELGPIAVLVVVADVGESGAAAESEIRQILSTLRPLGGARPK